MQRECFSQTDLEQAVKDGVTPILMPIPNDGWYTVTGSARVVLRESSHAELRESSHAELRESSHAELRESSHAELRGSSHAVLWESSHAVLWGSSHAELRGSSHAVLWESSHAVLWGLSHAELRGSSHAVLRESSHAVLWESSHAVLWESSHAVLWGSSHAELRGSSHAVLRESSHAEATKYATIAKQSSKAVAKGGVIVERPDLASAEKWLDFYGVPIVKKTKDGVRAKYATLFKAVDDEYRSGIGLIYSLDAPTVEKKFKANGQCGAGLHLCAHPKIAKTYFGEATKFLACLVRVEDINPILDGRSDKVKVPLILQCTEVDENGVEISARKAE